MKVTLAKTAGFCFGVKRAVEMVEEQLKENPGIPVYTWGPVIHNEEVQKDLASRGVVITESVEELKTLPKGIVVLRAHGISRELEEEIRATGMEVKDAACPFVKKIHRLAKENSEQGRQVIITGDPDHPEVQGIAGWCVNRPALVVRDAEEANALELPENTPICVVSQTTFRENKFKEVVAQLEKTYYDSIAVDTICNATHERQQEAESLSKTSDMMIVIGSKSSSNTQKLYEICRKHCAQTYFVQTALDIVDDWLQPETSVGITAGASTPKNIIEEVQTCLNLNKCWKKI